MLDSMVKTLWHKRASEGKPPDPAEVAEMQFGLKNFWHLRKHFMPALKLVGTSKKKNRVCRVVTRGGGKSVFIGFAILYLAEYVIPYIKDIRPENRRILVIGRRIDYTASINMKVLHEMLCQSAPWLKTQDSALWESEGSLLDLQIRQRKWTTTQMDFTNGVSVRAFGWGQSVRGEHAYAVFVDDLVDELNFAFTNSQLNTIQGAIGPALMYGGLLMVTGTPQGSDDIYHRLKQDPSWDSVWLPAYDMDGSLGYARQNQLDLDTGRLPKTAIKRPEDMSCLCPELHDFEGLEGERGTTRSSQIRFEKEYMLNPVTDTSLLVHPNDLAAAKNPAITYAKSVDEGQTYGGIDPSSLKEDEAAIVVGTVLPSGKRRVLCAERIARGQNPLIIIDKIKSLDERFNHPKWLCEANGFQAVIKPLLERDNPNIHIETKMLTSDKHTAEGFLLIRTMFEAGKVELPTGATEAESALLKAEKMSEVDVEAEVITNGPDGFDWQLKGIRVLEGKIVEDPNRKNDLVSALYLFLKSTEGVSAGIGVTSIKVNTPKIEDHNDDGPTRELRQERNRGLTETPGSKLQRILKYGLQYRRR